MGEHKYTQMRAKNRREVTRDGVTYIRFKGVLAYPVPNPDYVEKPEGEDTRTAKQKRKVVYKEVAKQMEAVKVTTNMGRGATDRNDQQTEANISAELEKWRDELESKKDSDVLLLDYMREYVDGRLADGIIEPSTSTDYKHTIARLERRFKTMKLTELTAKDVQNFQRAELKRGVSAATCGKVHRLLKQVLTYAYRHEDIAKNPMDIVEPPKRRKQNPNGLSISEAQRVTGILLDMQPTPVCTAAFMALHGSLRVGECCAVTWDDVNLEGKTIRVDKAIGLANGGAFLKTTKNNASNRVVNITDDLVSKLSERRDLMRKEIADNDILMTAEQFGKLYVCGTIYGAWLNPQIASRKWSAIAESHNIKGTEGKRATFHTLRHGFATVGIASGIDVATVAAQMGHSTVSQTLNTYTSALAESKERAASKMGDVLHPTETKKPATIHELKPAANE